ncbi:histidine triad nucleotide-binding 3 [Wolffia australiana]
MEGRRLAVIRSHLSQGNPSISSCGVHSSPCGGGSGGDASRRGRAADTIWKGNCIFCKIARGESPAFKLYEDDTCLCILDSNPLTPGHSLIIPKSHYRSLEETPPSVVSTLCSIIPLLSSAIMKATKSDSFNLLANSGAAAGQVVFHTHLHIIPRREDDCLWRSEGSLRKPFKHVQEAANLADDIREHLTCRNHEEPKLGEGE